MKRHYVCTEGGTYYHLSIARRHHLKEPLRGHISNKMFVSNRMTENFRSCGKYFGT